MGRRHLSQHLVTIAGPGAALPCGDGRWQPIVETNFFIVRRRGC
jgi:hypothetical protein